MSKGPDGLLAIPGISMDEWDRNFYYDYFVTKHRRNPTIVEIMDLNNANSEHSRHGFFRGRQVIDGEEQTENLFELVTATLTANPKGSVVAFKDNSSVVEGHSITTLLPDEPGAPSPLSRPGGRSTIRCSPPRPITSPPGSPPFPAPRPAPAAASATSRAPAGAALSWPAPPATAWPISTSPATTCPGRTTTPARTTWPRPWRSRSRPATAPRITATNSASR